MTTRGAASAALCVSLALAAPAQAAGGAADESTARLEIGVGLGGAAFDPHLEDYRWDISPAFESGLSATLLRGRYGAGARVWRSGTTQASGIPGETQAPRVNMTGLELTGQIRALSLYGVELIGSVHGGRLFLGYDPESLTFDVAGTPVTVNYRPISEWEYGAGAALRRDFAGHMALALQADLTSFSLDTAHRSGDEIVETRERFSTWNLRAQVSWVFGL